MNFFSTINFLRTHPNFIAKLSNNGKPYALNIRYDTEFDCFGWTDDNGKLFPNCHAPKGCKRVILSGKLIDSDYKMISLTNIPHDVIKKE